MQRKANIATRSKDSLAKIHHSITHSQAKTYINWWIICVEVNLIYNHSEFLCVHHCSNIVGSLLHYYHNIHVYNILFVFLFYTYIERAKLTIITIVSISNIYTHDDFFSWLMYSHIFKNICFDLCCKKKTRWLMVINQQSTY